MTRVRLMGGALSGRVLWVEKGAPWIDVNIAGETPPKRLRYKIEGSIASFEAQVDGSGPRDQAK